MTLIKSISGIRGTIGGKTGDNLTPIDIVKFTSAYVQWLENKYKKNKLKVVVGRDGRISGQSVKQIVINTLVFCGVDVIDIDYATTPTTEMAVTHYNADGGIILTASHNPKQWNALKLLNNRGEFASKEDGAFILNAVEKEDFNYADIDNIGKVCKVDDFDQIHIQKTLALPLVDVDAIKKANFTVVCDVVNSVGAKILPSLFEQLGVKYTLIHNELTGNFAHNPEPLKENLVDLANEVKKQKADVGFAVDPDVDRLAIMQEDGQMFGEEYTLVAVADYILSKTPGNTVSNMSSSRALRDVTNSFANCKYEASAVGELNVVELMKKNNAIIGGEGNGGVIYPELHYGRDSICGIALFLSHLAHKKMTVSQLRKTYPAYFMSKNKIQLTPEINVDKVLENMAKYYKEKGVEISTIDGVKADFAENWVHLRKSNTEPIIRIYTEAKSQEIADKLAIDTIEEIKKNI